MAVCFCGAELDEDGRCPRQEIEYAKVLMKRTKLTYGLNYVDPYDPLAQANLNWFNEHFPVTKALEPPNNKPLDIYNALAATNLMNKAAKLLMRDVDHAQNCNCGHPENKDICDRWDCSP